MLHCRAVDERSEADALNDACDVEFYAQGLSLRYLRMEIFSYRFRPNSKKRRLVVFRLFLSIRYERGRLIDLACF